MGLSVVFSLKSLFFRLMGNSFSCENNNLALGPIFTGLYGKNVRAKPCKFIENISGIFRRPIISHILS